MHNRGRLRLGLFLLATAAAGPPGHTKTEEIGGAAGVRGRLAGEDATGTRTGDARGGERPIGLLEQLELVFLFSSVDSGCPQIGYAPSKVWRPLPAQLGLGFGRLTNNVRCRSGPRRFRRSRLLLLLLRGLLWLEVVDLQLLRTRDRTQAERRGDGSAIHVERSLVVARRQRNGRRQSRLLLQLGIGDIDGSVLPALGVVAPARLGRGLPRVVGVSVFRAMGCASTNNAAVSRRSWTRRGSTCAPMHVCVRASGFDVRA